MRTIEQIEKIKEKQSKPTQLCKFVSEKDIGKLINHFEKSEKTKKDTGPEVVFIKEEDNILDDILYNLRQLYGNFKVRNAHFFHVAQPHLIHVDDEFDYPNSYKAFTIPLKVVGADCNLAKLMFFNQYYYGGPAKFVKGTDTKDRPVYYNSYLNDYNNVDGLDTQGINSDIRKHLTHLRPMWLQGLSFNSYFPWTIGSIIAFDSLQLHCASDFTKHNIKSKLGISIFTTWED